jgi:micrococcal nuclease
MSQKQIAGIACLWPRLAKCRRLRSWLLFAGLVALVSSPVDAAAQRAVKQPQATSPGVRGQQFSAIVTRVADGDTIQVTAGGSSYRVRLEGIDCPESGQPFSQVARNYTRQLAFDQSVSVKVLDVDRYGRLVARVTSQGKDVSFQLAKAGLAWHFTQYSSDPLLAAAEQEARKARRGLWADEKPIPPWVARRRPKVAATAPAALEPGAAAFVANTRSGVYHQANCQNARCHNCTRTFRDQASAQAAGFRRAGDCFASKVR